jgi:hypothetical protein
LGEFFVELGCEALLFFYFGLWSQGAVLWVGGDFVDWFFCFFVSLLGFG